MKVTDASPSRRCLFLIPQVIGNRRRSTQKGRKYVLASFSRRKRGDSNVLTSSHCTCGFFPLTLTWFLDLRFFEKQKIENFRLMVTGTKIIFERMMAAHLINMLVWKSQIGQKCTCALFALHGRAEDLPVYQSLWQRICRFIRQRICRFTSLP